MQKPVEGLFKELPFGLSTVWLTGEYKVLVYLAVFDLKKLCPNYVVQDDVSI
jgi:hypothetical protein